jgi:hypothetical protein
VNYLPKLASNHNPDLSSQIARITAKNHQYLADIFTWVKKVKKGITEERTTIPTFKELKTQMKTLN